MATRQFSVWDYVVFGAVLVVSAAIGVYQAVRGRGRGSTQEFLLADRSLPALPLALSVLASFFSASTLLGTPAEIYQFGTMYWLAVIGAMLAPLTGALLFGPLFYKIKVVSVFEYLERRFKSAGVRKLGAALFLVRATVGMGIVLFGPSTALSAVTSFPDWAIIVLVGVVCTFYTAIGGLKAVVWTDVFQTLVMLGGMLTVLIMGCLEAGGIGEVWRKAEEGGRIAFSEFSADPHVRHTFWSLTLGMYLVWLPPYSVDQQMVQRFSAARSLRDARRSLLYNVPGMFIIITLCCLTGLTLYAHYAHCDPLRNKDAGNPNQLLPLYVMDILGDLHGLPGLFVACLFSGALSSVSSMLNSLAAVTWEDFLKPVLPPISDSAATHLNKGLAAVYGAVGVGLAFLVKQLGGTVLQASLTLNGAIGAPLVGIFILGTGFTSTNKFGAAAGGLAGFALSIWLSVGAYLTKPLDFRLPTDVSMCNVTAIEINVTAIATNVTTMATNVVATTTNVVSMATSVVAQTTEFTKFSNGTTTLEAVTTTLSPSDPARLQGLEKFYGISYLWFTSLGVLATLVVGLVVSLLTGRTREEDVEEELLLRVGDRVLACCRPGRTEQFSLADPADFTDLQSSSSSKPAASSPDTPTQKEENHWNSHDGPPLSEKPGPAKDSQL